jgi:protein TonB
VGSVAKHPRLRREIAATPPSAAAQSVAGLDDRVPPDLSGNRPPAYPPVALAQHLEGTVLLRLHIAATGRVQRVQVVKSSGHGVLDRAAVEAVSTWRGRPAQRAGRPLATIELLPVRFRL